MPHDPIDERRDTPTVSAPPPSDPEVQFRGSTQPPGPDDEAARAYCEGKLPPPARVPGEQRSEDDSYFTRAARDFAASLVELRATRKEIADGFRVQGEKIDAAAREHAANYNSLRDEFMRFRDGVIAKDADQDGKLAALTSRVDQLEKAPAPG